MAPVATWTFSRLSQASRIAGPSVLPALATAAGRPFKTINEIVNGKKAITAETALQLENALGISAHTWMNLQTTYDLAKARAKLA